jgi:hypothetical protein
LMAIAHEKVFTRSLFSFASLQADVIVEFDASLSGGGILFFDAVDSRCLGISTINLISLNLTDESRYQNYAEFLVALVGLIGAIYLRPNLQTVSFVGDSLSALSWLESGRLKSDIASNLSIIFMHLCVKYNLKIVETTHISGVNNTSADNLSRGHRLEDVRIRDSRINSNLQIIIPCSMLFSLANPLNIPTNDHEFLDLWNAIPIVINQMIQSITSV